MKKSGIVYTDERTGKTFLAENPEPNVDLSKSPIRYEDVISECIGMISELAAKNKMSRQDVKDLIDEISEGLNG